MEKIKNIFFSRIFNLLFNIAFFSCMWYNLLNYNRVLYDRSNFSL